MSEWEERFSKSKNRPYFFNTKTRESVWERPPADDKIRCSHLLVKHKDSRNPSSWKESTITRTKQQAMDMIHGFRERIVSGSIKLEELAKVTSDCSSAKRGGDLGYFGRGQMQASFESAAFNLKVGELSNAVESDSGIHLILKTA